jgi:hypothetical protein
MLLNAATTTAGVIAASEGLPPITTGREDLSSKPYFDDLCARHNSTQQIFAFRVRRKHFTSLGGRPLTGLGANMLIQSVLRPYLV